MSSYLDPKLNRLLGATLEDVLGFAGYYLIAETFDVVILRATYEMANWRTVMSGMSVDKVIEFLIDRNLSLSDPRPFGCAVSGAGINVVPVSYSVYRCKEVSPALVTGSTPEIWKWAKSKGLLEQYVYERNPINQSMIAMDNPTASLQLDDCKDYLSNQERWGAEIAKLLTTTCPSVGIRRNHKTAPELYEIYEKGGSGNFAVLHTLMFLRFLRAVDKEFSEPESLLSAWIAECKSIIDKASQKTKKAKG